MRKVFAASVFLGLVGPSHVSADTWRYEPNIQDCEIAYVFQILRKPGHKAVATTGGRPLGVHPTGCGFASGYKTLQAARAAAITECRKSEGQAYPGKCVVIESR